MQSYRELGFQKRAGFWTIPKLSLLFTFLLASFYAFNLFNLKTSTLASITIFQSELKKIRSSASNLKTDETLASLRKIDEEIKKISFQAKITGLPKLASLLGQIKPGAKELADALENLSKLSSQTLAMAETLDYLKNNAAELILNQNGKRLIQNLENLESNLKNIESLNLNIKKQSLDFKKINPQLASLANILEKNYMPVSLNLYRTENFLSSLISLLKSPDDQNFLLIFQNPSELRPAGGFIGSYGEFILNQGNLKKIEVDDIYNADRQLDLKLIPPRELQSITNNWGARDANWFFNFPTSAQKVISLLEKSDLFSRQNIQFQGAIAINTQVLGNILKITGPISLPKYNKTLDSENFLKEIQYEVEAGEDKKPGENPKRILSALAPLIMEKLKNLNPEEKNRLATEIKNDFEQKNIQIYFKDRRIQNFIESAGVGGEIFELPINFQGDYLAVVSANIAGGKSDAFTSQHISLKSEIAGNGQIKNNLVITKKHNGQNEEAWWYRSDNKSYLKIFAPKESKLISVTGNQDPKPNKDIMNYLKSGYAYDIDLEMIERSAQFLYPFKTWLGEEAGKNYFGIWFTVPAGQTKNLTVNYNSGKTISLKKETSYEFVFEKQSGSNSSLEYSISAPSGYIWKESNNQIFEYGIQQPKAREIIKLTLRAIK